VPLYNGRTSRRAFTALTLAALALALGTCGCGGSDSTPAARERPSTRGTDGAAVFAQAGCGGCHTLASAKAGGNVGPNLDQLKPDAATVARQVRSGGSGMPSFGSRLSGREIDAVAAYVARAAKGAPLARQSFGSIAADFKPDATKVARCGSDWRCYEQAFGNLAYARGPRVALTAFARSIQTNGDVRADCHLIAHAIGAGAFVRLHDAGKAFVAAGPLAMTCSSGFYHGVLQRALHGVQAGDLAAVARRLCAGRAVKTSPFVLSQCVHGLGHGLMIYTGYDLRRALATCHRLATSYDQLTCTGGVFMENFTTSMSIRSPWLKTGDPLYPCDAVAARDKVYCYFQVTSHLLEATRWNWRETVRWCRKVEAGYVVLCFQSLGRDISGYTLQDAPEILRLCALSGDMARECIYGAARDITNMDAGARRSAPFCAQVPAGDRAYCFEGIGTIVGSFHVYGRDRKAECRADVPRKYWRDCFAGANV
jgi:mono/diheme cytochrome c family protein